MCVFAFFSAISAPLLLLGAGLVCNGFRPHYTPSSARRVALATRTRKCSTSSAVFLRVVTNRYPLVFVFFKTPGSSWLDTSLVFVVFFLSFFHGMIVESLGVLGVSFAGLPLFLLPPLLRRLSLPFA